MYVLGHSSTFHHFRKPANRRELQVIRKKLKISFEQPVFHTQVTHTDSPSTFTQAVHLIFQLSIENIKSLFAFFPIAMQYLTDLPVWVSKKENQCLSQNPTYILYCIKTATSTTINIMLAQNHKETLCHSTPNQSSINLDTVNSYWIAMSTAFGNVLQNSHHPTVLKVVIEKSHFQSKNNLGLYRLRGKSHHRSLYDFRYFRIINQCHCNTLWIPIHLLNKLLVTCRMYLVFISYYLSNHVSY